MPELPEVEATCRAIAPAIVGRKIAAVHLLRPLVARPQPPSTLARLAIGRKIAAVRRRGKNILIDLSGGFCIRLHLRMTGRLRAAQPISAATRVWFELGRSQSLVFDDPRALGRVHIHTAEETQASLASLGPEPLSRSFTQACFVEAARSCRQPAKLFLMDQRRVAGLGNIYAAEALFQARINPQSPMSSLTLPKLAALHKAIVAVLRKAVKSANMTYIQPGEFHKASRFIPAVYGREGQPCQVCGNSIRRIPQGGRSTYFCPSCQR